MPKARIQRLNRPHDRTGFDCGEQGYNDFLRKQALQHMRQNTSVTWVAVEEGGSRILGYATLSMGSVEFEHILPEIAARLPRHPMPVLHVGKLAVDAGSQGRGIGSLLLRFAGLQAITLADEVGCHAVELIADDERLARYYASQGFLPLRTGTLRLYLPVETLRRARDEAARRTQDRQ